MPTIRTDWQVETIRCLKSLAEFPMSNRDLIKWANSQCLITDHEWVQLQHWLETITANYEE